MSEGQKFLYLTAVDMSAALNEFDAEGMFGIRGRHRQEILREPDNMGFHSYYRIDHERAGTILFAEAKDVLGHYVAFFGSGAPLFCKGDIDAQQVAYLQSRLTEFFRHKAV